MQTTTDINNVAQIALNQIDDVCIELNRLGKALTSEIIIDKCRPIIESAYLSEVNGENVIPEKLYRLMSRGLHEDKAMTGPYNNYSEFMKNNPTLKNTIFQLLSKCNDSFKEKAIYDQIINDFSFFNFFYSFLTDPTAFYEKYEILLNKVKKDFTDEESKKGCNFHRLNDKPINLSKYTHSYLIIKDELYFVSYTEDITKIEFNMKYQLPTLQINSKVFLTNEFITAFKPIQDESMPHSKEFSETVSKLYKKLDEQTAFLSEYQKYMQPIKGLVQLPINMLNVASTLAFLASGFTSLIYFGFIYYIFPRSTIITLIEYITDYKYDDLVSNFITPHIDNLLPNFKALLERNNLTYDINGIKQFMQINTIQRLTGFTDIMTKLNFNNDTDGCLKYIEYIQANKHLSINIAINKKLKYLDLLTIEDHLKAIEEIESINTKFNRGLYFLPQSYFASKALSRALLKPLPTDTSDVVLSILYKFSILILAVPLLILTIVNDIILYATFLLPLAVLAIKYLTTAIFIVTMTIPLYIAQFLNSIFAFETDNGSDTQNVFESTDGHSTVNSTVNSTNIRMPQPSISNNSIFKKSGVPLDTTASYAQPTQTDFFADID